MSAPVKASAEVRIAALYRSYAPQLVRIVAGRLGRPRAEVEDACQDAWAILARRHDVLDGPAPRAWLVTVAVHAWLHAFRGAPVPLGKVPDPIAPPIEDALEAREALRAVAELRPVRRRVFERRLAGLSYHEIAAELGLTYTNVIWRRGLSSPLAKRPRALTTCRRARAAPPLKCCPWPARQLRGGGAGRPRCCLSAKRH